ncbi:hypothetical protein, partial [Bartonella sp. CL63NXGY]|uniref:hypothetical protein n=1 Tax=Bartonella sp. CL63NXGY TaxID=3243538 RepID=UPI0035D0D4C0
IGKKNLDRVTPRDAYAIEAGVFELEYLDYQQQLHFKRQVVIDSLEKFQPYGYRAYDVRPTIPAPHQYGYRNKATFQVRMIDGHVAAGLYKTGSHDLVDMVECAVQMPATMKVMRTRVKLIEQLGIAVYNEEHN